MRKECNLLVAECIITQHMKGSIDSNSIREKPSNTALIISWREKIIQGTKITKLLHKGEQKMIALRIKKHDIQHNHEIALHIKHYNNRLSSVGGMLVGL
jgi:hypothetical protein